MRLCVLTEYIRLRHKGMTMHTTIEFHIHSKHDAPLEFSKPLHHPGDRISLTITSGDGEVVLYLDRTAAQQLSEALGALYPPETPARHTEHVTRHPAGPTGHWEDVVTLAGTTSPRWVEDTPKDGE